MIEIRLVQENDAALFADYYAANASHLKPWEPERELGYHSQQSWHSRLQNWCKGQQLGLEAHFIAIQNEQMIGLANLSGVIQGPFKACYLGYSVDGTQQGQGIGRQLVQHSCDYAFAHLKLNRVMANYMPSNKRSARLLKSLGFQREGQALKYLKIDGRWRDHVLTALVNTSDS